MRKASIMESTRELNAALSKLKFPENDKVRVFNALEDNEALGLFEKYVDKYGQGQKDNLFVGMNPTPDGMARTGVPFGDPECVKSWLKLKGFVDDPIEGYEYGKSERSGENLWGLFKSVFCNAKKFFNNNFVINYCPLIFLRKDKSGTLSLENLVNNKNRGGEKIFSDEQYEDIKKYISDMRDACDKHLVSIIEILKPVHVIAFGNAVKEYIDNIHDIPCKLCIFKVRHPANLGRRSAEYQDKKKYKSWGDIATDQLIKGKVWPNS